MSLKIRPSCLLMLAALSVGNHAAVAEDAVGPLHVIRPILHADQQEAELCLEFDHALDIISTPRAAEAVHIESEGHIVPVMARAISLAGDQLCVSGLAHRRDYRLELGGLRDAKGEQLSRPYSFSFTVPPRQAGLAFAYEADRAGMMPWQNAPVLHSVNVSRVDVELYRIDDPTHMAEAWGQRLQIRLAPSESLYFAQHNGTLVWKGALKPEGAPDSTIDTPIDFAANGLKDVPPGFYLIAAFDPDAKHDHKKDKDQDKQNPLATTAAVWSLRSALSITALRDDKTFTVLTDAANAAAVMPDIRVLAFDHDPKIIAESKSDVEGVALVTPKADKSAETQSLIGIGAKGDAAFIDPASDLIASPVLAPLHASVAVDRAFYAPREMVTVVLSVRDLHHRPAIITGSTLQLLRPDRTPYDRRAVTLDPQGRATLSLLAPGESGVWHLTWKQADNSALADMPLRITGNVSAPVLSAVADRAAIAGDGAVNLTIHGETAPKTPAAFVTGHVELTWAQAEHPFTAWRDYHFDDGNLADAKPKLLGTFITDSHGIAHFHALLPLGDKGPVLRQASLRVVSDPGLGALDPQPVLLPVKPNATFIGLRPLSAHGHFPENSMARFDVVALDGDGQRRATQDLTYQIYQQGRGFEWQEKEGLWNYKPQPQRRRIGGGQLSVPESGPATIEWPVTSGAYRVEVTDDDGHLRARLDFDAGWAFASDNNDEAVPLALEASTPVLSPGHETSVKFTLPHAGIVTALIADDKLHTVIHRAYPAGTNIISFTPATDWGDQIAVQINARYASENGGGQALGKIILPVGAPDAAAPPPRPAPSPHNLLPPRPLPTLTVVVRKQIASQQSWTIPPDTKSGPVFVAPQPFFDLPTLLSATLQHQPYFTTGLARRLETLRQWHDVAVAAGLMTDAEFRQRQNDLLLRLLARQKDDGGFAAMPGEMAEDIVSTAAALRVLAAFDDTTIRPASDQAAGWLQRRVANTWFSEDERPQRAAAYAALAATNKLDLASLRYFSDSSAQKPFTPLAAAQMAYAFASTNDKAAANFWIGKIEKDPTGANPLAAETLRVLLANPFYATADASTAMEHESARLMATPETMNRADDFLLALWQFEDRSGAWRAVIGKDERSLRGVFVMDAADRGLQAVRNPASDSTLYVAVASPAFPQTQKGGPQRTVYTLDGAAVDARHSKRGIYIVMLEGSWPKDKASTLLVRDDPQPFMAPITCAIGTPNADGFLGWLAAKPLTPVRSCEKGVATLLLRGDEEGSWRIAYLAQMSDTHGIIPAASATPVAVNPDDKDDRR